MKGGELGDCVGMGPGGGGGGHHEVDAGGDRSVTKVAEGKVAVEDAELAHPSCPTGLHRD